MGQVHYSNLFLGSVPALKLLLEELSALGPSLGRNPAWGRPVSACRQRVHKPDGLGREAFQELLVKGLGLNEQTGHTVVKGRHGDDQTKAHTTEPKLGLQTGRQKPEDSEETTLGREGRSKECRWSVKLPTELVNSVSEGGEQLETLFCFIL